MTNVEKELLRTWRIRSISAPLIGVAGLRELHRRLRSTVAYEDQGPDDFSWQLPHQTLSRLRGNCNDFAVLAYYTLRMSWPIDEGNDGIRLLHCTIPGYGGHMICGAVLDGDMWLLDNRAPRVYRLEDADGITVNAQLSSSHVRAGDMIVGARSERFDALLARMSEYEDSEFLMPDMGGG